MVAAHLSLQVGAMCVCGYVGLSGETWGNRLISQSGKVWNRGNRSGRAEWHTKRENETTQGAKWKWELEAGTAATDRPAPRVGQEQRSHTQLSHAQVKKWDSALVIFLTNSPEFTLTKLVVNVARFAFLLPLTLIHALLHNRFREGNCHQQTKQTAAAVSEPSTYAHIRSEHREDTHRRQCQSSSGRHLQKPFMRCAQEVTPIALWMVAALSFSFP